MNDIDIINKMNEIVSDIEEQAERINFILDLRFKNILSMENKLQERKIHYPFTFTIDQKLDNDESSKKTMNFSWGCLRKEKKFRFLYSDEIYKEHGEIERTEEKAFVELNLEKRLEAFNYFEEFLLTFRDHLKIVYAEIKNKIT